MPATARDEGEEGRARDLGAAVAGLGKRGRQDAGWCQDKKIRRTAEIVMLLAGMAQLRAGKPPGTKERSLAAKAFRNLSVLTECVAPELLVSGKAVESLIRDLGLGTECQRIGGFRPGTAEAVVECFDPATSARFLSDEDGPESASSEGDPMDCSSDWALDDEARSSGNGSWHGEMMTLCAAGAGDLGACWNRLGALSQFMGRSGRSDTAAVFGLPADASLVLGQEAYRKQLRQAVQRYVMQTMKSVRARPSDRVVSSTSFMTPPIPCEMCQRVAKDAASVLLCDSCDCAYHVVCLLNFNARPAAKGDWVCPRCVILHKGRPQPPQYGPMRIPHHAHKSHHRHVAGRSLAPISHQTTVTSTGTSLGGQSPTKGETVRYLQIDHKLLNAAQRGVAVVDTEFPSSQVRGKVESKSRRDPRKQGKEGCSPVHTNVKCSSSCSTGQTRVQTRSSNVGREGGFRTEVDAESNGPPYSTLPLLDAQSKGVYRGGDTVSRGEAEEGAASDEIASRVEEGETRCGVPEKVADASTVVDLRDQEQGSSEDLHVMDWVGKVLHEVQGRVYYGACRVGNHVFKQDDFALFQPESSTAAPYIARLQSLWEDTEQGSKWARVSWCYHPSDIPMHTVRPSEPDHDEVYESNHCDDNPLASIQGRCQVLHHAQYCAEVQKRGEAVEKGVTPGGGMCPIFACRWVYDAVKRTFEAVAEEEASSE